MEQQNISFDKGIHRTPSLGDASELSECVNVMPQYGEMRNIEPPTTDSDAPTITAGRTLVYVHSKSGINSYKNYITKIKINNVHKVYLENSNTELLGKEPLSITSVGNTLCIATSEGIYHFLWKNNAYVSLGNHIPDVSLSFGLRSIGLYIYNNNHDFPADSSDDNFTTLSETAKTQLREWISSVMNPYQENVKKHGYIVYPVLITYALKLFDGTNVRHSAPVLLVPNEQGHPGVKIAGLKMDDNNWKFTISVETIAAKINAKLLSSVDSLENWSDIITSVEIFISLDLQKSKAESGIKLQLGSGYKELSGYASHVGNWNFESKSGDEFIEELNTHFNDSSSVSDPSHSSVPYSQEGNKWIDFEQLGESDFFDKVCDNNDFYKISEIKLSDLGNYNDRKFLRIEDDVLDVLATQKSLSIDTSYSRDSISGGKIFSYNSRLIVVDARRKLEGDFDSATLVPFIANDVTKKGTAKVFVEFEYGNKTEIIRLNDSAIGLDLSQGMQFISYPDENAKVIYYFDGGGKRKIVLEPSGTLNCASAFNNMGEIGTSSFPDTVNSLITKITSGIVDQSNRIFMSEVDNAFYFKGSKALTLPSHVLNISTAAKALSQGQFGQFPLYAFCEDGVWAVSVNDEGYLSSKQPITRDVLLHPNSICQLDNSVAFVTNEGVKVLSGSNSTCISTSIHGFNFDESIVSSYISSTDLITDSEPFYHHAERDGVSMVYDSAHQLLHLFSPSLDTQKAHFVNLLGTNEWVMQKLDNAVKAVVPGYPYSYMQFGTAIKQYKHLNDSTTKRSGYFLTRPCYMGNMFTRKTLYDLRMVGQKTKSDTSRSIIVLISNDGNTWYRLNSLKARSAKFYRFLIKTSMYDADTLSGMALQYEERYKGKLR